MYGTWPLNHTLQNWPTTNCFANELSDYLVTTALISIYVRSKDTVWLSTQIWTSNTLNLCIVNAADLTLDQT